jgi:hypothetical protein
MPSAPGGMPPVRHSFCQAARRSPIRAQAPGSAASGSSAELGELTVDFGKAERLGFGLWSIEQGSPRKALAPLEETVAIYRELAKASPDRYLPDLANALANQGALLPLLDRPAESLPPTQEAVAIYRELACDRLWPGMT